MWKPFLDKPFDSPGCLRLSQGGLRLSRESFFIPRLAQASCGSAASAGPVLPSVELAPRLWSPSASLGCSV